MKKIAAIFDLDETIYPDHSQKDVILFMFKKKQISPVLFLKVLWWYFLKKINRLDYARACAEGATLLEGISIDKFHKTTQECFDQVLRRRISNNTIEFVKKYKKMGLYMILATSTITPVAQVFADFFGFNHLIGTDVEVKNGILTGELASPVCMNSAKSDLIKEFCTKNNINLVDSYTFGRTVDDVSLLNLTKNPIVINPTSALKKLAIEKNWQILDINTK